MLSADIFEAFTEVGFSNKTQIKALFKRYIFCLKQLITLN